MRMCDFNILHHNANGYVVKCPECKSLKVAFGTNTFSLTDRQFTEFQQIIRDHHRANSECGCRRHRRIEITTSVKSINLLYSLEELEDLTELLNEAELALEIEKLLNTPINN